MKPINLTKVYKNYKGLWVALKSSTNPTAIASGKSFKEIMNKVKKTGIKQPLVTQIPKEVLPIVGKL